MSDYTRTKQEYQDILGNMLVHYGKYLSIPITKIHQNGNEMFSAPIRTDLAHLLFQRLPRGYENEEGIQRAFKDSKIKEIEMVAKEPHYSAPGSMVATVETNPEERPWVHLKWNPNERRGDLIIDLAMMETQLANLEEDEGGQIDEEQFKIGYMIDAHHRTEGHWRAGRKDLEMNATLYTNLKRAEMARVFTGVNEKQEKPSPTHTLAMKEMAGILSNSEERAVDLAKGLNDNKLSILHERISMFDGRRPTNLPTTYVKLKPFTDLLAKYVLPYFGKVEELDDQIQLLENYFKAWSLVFPTAWVDTKKHVLVKAMGFSIITRLFEKIIDITRFQTSTNIPSAEQFRNVIKKLDGAKINTQMDGGRPSFTELDWNSATFGGMSSGKGINFLAQEAKSHLSTLATSMGHSAQ